MIPCSSALVVSCAPGTLLGGYQGGQVCSLIVTHCAPKLFFGQFLLFLADFSIFSDLLKIISVLGIRCLVSTEYLKTLYILYSEW
jgi:hypothetical protein